jgi:hypothetical protein
MNKLLSILILFLSCPSFGQSPKVVLSIDPCRAEVGEIFTITIKSNVQGEVEVDNKPSSFVPGYDIMNGMEQEMDPNTGDVITYYYLSQTGAIGKPGKYTIGPAFIKRGNKVYQSNTVEIVVGDKTQMTGSEVTSAQLKEDAFGIIQTNKKTIYEGEPILVSAKVYSHFDPSHLAGYRSYSMKGAVDRQPVGNSQRIIVEREKFKGIDLYAFEYDKNIVFPSGTGTFKINGYAMNLHRGYESYPITSNQAVIEILPLPGIPPADFIGGVGNFSVDRTIDAKSMTQGDVFKMKIKVNGVGNLQNTIEPTPILPKGLIVYGDPVIVEEYSYNSHGTEGSITYEYNIQVNSHGDIEIPAMTISFFDINKKKYVTSESETENITVKADKSYITQETQDPKSSVIEELPYISTLRDSNSNLKENVFFGTPLFWVGIGSPLFAALLFIFIRRKRESDAEEIILKERTRQKDKELSTSLSLIESSMNSNDDNVFYTGIEGALIKAFEIRLDVQDDRILNKTEIYDYLKNSGQIDLLSKVKHVFTTTDQFRYGFASTNDSKQQLYSLLNEILTQIK